MYEMRPSQSTLCMVCAPAEYIMYGVPHAELSMLDYKAMADRLVPVIRNK